jgi:hypothetical protein
MLPCCIVEIAGTDRPSTATKWLADFRSLFVEAAVDHKPPAPTIITFIVCRELYIRITPAGPERTLVAPTINFWSWRFPAKLVLGYYVEFTNGHGDYLSRIELHNVDGQYLAHREHEKPFSAPDPLRVHVLAEELRVGVPVPGRYDLLLLMNGEEVARRQLHVYYPDLRS